MTSVGADGLASALKPAFTMTPSSLHYPPMRKNLLAAPSYPAIASPSGMRTADLRGLVNDHWSQALSERPSATWLQRFRSISNLAPCTSRMERPCDRRSTPCYKLLTTSIRPRNNNRQLRPSSCKPCTRPVVPGSPPLTTPHRLPQPSSPSWPSSSQ